MHAPLRSSSSAVAMRLGLLGPRWTGMCPMPFMKAATTRFFHSVDFASARIGRTSRAATAIAIGSQ